MNAPPVGCGLDSSRAPLLTKSLGERGPERVQVGATDEHFRFRKGGKPLEWILHVGNPTFPRGMIIITDKTWRCRSGQPSV